MGAAITLGVENTELLAEIERKKRSAETANQDKSRFFAAVSHDLRQPLYAMGLLLESLGERLATSEQKTLHGNIERTHHAMADMFGSLLEISQLDAAAVQISRQAVFLDRIVGTLIEEFAPSAAQTKLKLEFTPTGAWVESDPVLLSRILRNLLSNAIKFTDAGV